VEKPYNLTTF